MDKEMGWALGLLLVGGVLGWTGALVLTEQEVKEVCSYNRTIDGFWAKNVTKERVKEMSKETEVYGDWINVNIRGMSYKRALEVAQHELGHEIFAEVCEKNMSRCLEVVDG